jgi:hypothetical protein
MKEALNSFHFLKSHSFTFYINGSPEPKKFASLQQWYDTVLQTWRITMSNPTEKSPPLIIAKVSLFTTQIEMSA